MSRSLYQRLNLDLRMALALFVLFTGLYGLTARAHFSIADEETFYHVIESLVERGTFAQLPEAKAGPAPRALVENKYGVLYAVTAPVQSILAIPFYVMGRWVGRFFPELFLPYFTRFFVALFNGPVTALTVACVYMLVRELRGSRRTALFTAFAVGLGSVLWPYARTFFGESLLAFWLVVATWAMIRYVRTAQPGWLALWGSVFGLGVLTKYIMVISFPIFFLYLLAVFFRMPKRQRWPWARRSLTTALIPLVTLTLLGGAFNYARFGSILETGYTQSERRGSVSSWAERARPLVGGYGFLFSSGKGFFFFSPPAVLFFLGFKSLYRRWREETVLLLGLILIYPAFYSFVTHNWHGGGNWGPRYIVCVTPLVLLIGGFFLERRDLSQWLRVLVATGLLVLGVWVQISFHFVNFATYLFSDVPVERQRYHPVHSPLLAQWRLWPRQLQRWQRYDHAVRTQEQTFYTLNDGFYDVEVPEMAPFGRWTKREAELLIYSQLGRALNISLEYTTSYSEALTFTYNGFPLSGERDLVQQEGGNYQWREHLTVPAVSVQIVPGTLRMRAPLSATTLTGDERELGIFLSYAKIVRDGTEISPLEARLPEPIPLVPDYPWSFDAMLWFYNPRNARPFDLWPAYVWTSGIPLKMVMSFIVVLVMFFLGWILGGALWLRFLVSRNL